MIGYPVPFVPAILKSAPWVRAPDPLHSMENLFTGQLKLLEVYRFRDVRKIALHEHIFIHVKHMDTFPQTYELIHGHFPFSSNVGYPNASNLFLFTTLT